MSSEPRYRSVPLNRRWISDFGHFGKKAHIVGCTWRLNVAPVVAARAAHQPAIGWAAIWMKGMALVGRRRTELRTAYLPFPWAHLYLHPESVCTVVIERTWRGSAAVFFEQFRRPDAASLADLDSRLRSLKQVPVESVGSFRRLIRLARPPVIVRRLLWSIVFNWSGPLRGRYAGTFAINPFPTGGSVTQSTTPISFLLYYGLIEPNGDTQVHILFDHRVIDGTDVYRMLRDIEATLNRDIVTELSEGSASAKAGSSSPAQDDTAIDHDLGTK
jgi:hypothetical protein